MPNPKAQEVTTVLKILQKTYLTHPMHEAFKHDPFQMLVAVVLSQRATDAMTIPVAKRLFNQAGTPAEIAQLSTEKLEAILRPIGFFHAKAAAIQKLSKIIVEKFDGKVPTTEVELLSLPQVGRKTANIMLTLFFNTPQIAVDVHVHRITHRLGWVRTKTTDETEVALTKLIPKKFIHDVNRVFVRHGQVICKPISPKCSICPIQQYCTQVGVMSSR
ncbi:MAG: Endonuclease III [Candidatus Amesbacteria bacterium GW2011_GWA2_42_12]|uniref:Endonuclease III n=1 Tax=Candidatus Amesbacteria bacterium GW2011_GWA2_42_12 TaxID=1618356 RepID=A0A0G0Y3E1_9BACT|nr:MAG: Endonuclease III [Candidatus Amesbacteria bacterium GW2011_GWA2_42_12]